MEAGSASMLNTDSGITTDSGLKLETNTSADNGTAPVTIVSDDLRVDDDLLKPGSNFTTPPRPEQPVNGGYPVDEMNGAANPTTPATVASTSLPAEPSPGVRSTTLVQVPSQKTQQPEVEQAPAVIPSHSRTGSYSSMSVDPPPEITSSLVSNSTALVPATTTTPISESTTDSSNLNLHTEPGLVQLYDRDKEMGILTHEYTTMVKRALRSSYSKKEKRLQNISPEDEEDDDEDFGKGEIHKKLTSVLCIAGKAGTGKTALARSLAHSVESNGNKRPGSGAYFLYGKCDWPTTSVTSTLQAQPHMGDAPTSFDETQIMPSLALAFKENEQAQHHEPFAAFAMMLDCLLLQIEAKGLFEAEQVRRRIRDAIGLSGISIVGELSPKLGHFLRVVVEETSANSTPPTFVTADNNTNNKDSPASKKDKIRVHFRVPRMKYILREFFRALTSDNSPCVVILDDAQWADQESLQLARHLHSDSENPLLMLILTWRTNDIHEEESCYTAVGSSIGIFADDLVRRINLKNLTLNGVILLVAEALQIPSSQVGKLAKTVHAKTLGNPFHVKQYLMALEQEFMLRWSPARKLWRWDDAKIASMDSGNKPVGELIKERIHKLSTESLAVLKILSCLGQSFEETTACAIVEKVDTVEMFDVEVSSQEAGNCVESLVRDGYLERRYGSKRLSFSHDRLQESVFQLLPKDSRPLLLLRIGERLLEVMEEVRSESVSFLGVDLCSKGISFLSQKERMGLALYNLLAGEKCMARSSFASSLAYFEYGLSSLRVNDFLKGRLSLELSFGAMESAFCVDDFEKVRLHYDRITSSGSNPDEMIRAHVLVIHAIGSHGDPAEAISTGISVLQSIDVRTVVESPSKVSLFVQLKKTKGALRRHSEDELANLRELSVTKLRQAMRIIEAMLPYAYMHDRQLFMHLVMKAVRWSIKNGVCSQSALAFAALGSFPAFQAMDIHLATICGQTALLLMDRFGGSDYPGMVMFLVHSQILNWTTDLGIVQDHLDRTYRVSMESGDQLSAYCSLGASYAISYESGNKTLGEMEILGEIYSRRIHESGSESIAAIHDTTWQTVLNLRGDNYDPSDLTGRAIKNQDETVLLARTSGNDLLEFMVLSRQIQLSYLMGQHDRADAFRIRSEDTIRSVASSPILVSHVAYCALNCLALCASRTPLAKRNSSHHKTAARLLKKLRYWHDDQGYRYCGNMVNLVQAESYRVAGNFKAAEEYFERSIADADRFSNPREKGLAHELKGRHLLRDQNEEVLAADHLDKAMQSYHSWGGTALVNKILEKYDDVLQKNPQPSDTSSVLISEKTNKTAVV